MRRALATLVLAAGLVGGCATPTPDPSSTSAASVAVVSTPTVAPTPTLAPTTNVETEPPATPGPTIEPMGVAAFSPLASGEWEITMSADNFDPTGQQTNFGPMSAFAEIFVQCAGDGQLTLRMTASPQQGAPDELATPTPLGSTTLDCRTGDRTTISLAGTAPDGWFASPDITLSDPSITYQVLVGTIVD